MSPTILVLLFVLGLCAGLPEPEGGLPMGELHRLRRQATGGKCSTSAECIAPNVCSKWGWCQWTDIYGQDGPSQGQSAPDGGRSGQCVTSADCASRVPYCSRQGFCHGGRLPFDEEQLEVDPFEPESQGYVNNNPQKNSPVFKGGDYGRQNDQEAQEERKPRRQQQQQQQQRKNQGSLQQRRQQQRPRNNTVNRRNNSNRINEESLRNKSYENESCPGGDYGSCVLGACESTRELPQGDRIFAACERECQQRCN